MTHENPDFATPEEVASLHDLLKDDAGDPPLATYEEILLAIATATWRSPRDQCE